MDNSSDLRGFHVIAEGSRSTTTPLTTTEVARASDSDAPFSGPTLSAVSTSSAFGSEGRPSAHRKLKAVLVTADLVAILLAILTATEFRLHLVGGSRTGIRTALGVGLLSLPIWLVLLFHNRLYTARHLTTVYEEWRRTASTVIAGCLGLAATTFLVNQRISRGWTLTVVPVAFSFLVSERAVVRWLFTRARACGRASRRVIIVGTNKEGRALAEMLSASPMLGYKVVGFVEAGRNGGDQPDTSVLGSLEDVVQLMQATRSNGVFIAPNALDVAATNQLTRLLVKYNFHVELSSALTDVRHSRLSIRPLGPFSVMSVEPAHHGGWRPVAKRALDLVLALLLLVLVMPLLLVIAVVVKLDSRGPVLFRQKRVGRYGCPFVMLKIRTMVTDAEHHLPALLPMNQAAGPLFKLQNDPRVTRCGRLLRSWSLDEIPQLVNVIKGDMSLVGPRPALAREVREWSPELHDRLQVRPGMTGMWQVKGRAGASFDDYVRLDLFYVENWSLGTDLSILARTVPAVLRRAGAW